MIGLTGKRTFKSSLCVTYFTVSSPNFIRREPFNTQNEDISLPDHSALHLDHKYLQQLQRLGLIINKVIEGKPVPSKLAFFKDFLLFIT